MSSAVCISISPVKVTDSDEVLHAAISCSSILPPPGLTVSEPNEVLELRHLSKTLGWSNPKGLYGYSVDSEYKDLYVYFDYGDKTSPVNEVATRAFSMYGLGGAMVNGPPAWGSIRGNVFIVRMEPDYNFSPGITFEPMISIEEMYQTLVFFRDSEKSAYEHALKRDSVRFMKGFGMDYFGSTGDNNSIGYIGATGKFRSGNEIFTDMNVCDHCGKTQAVLGKKLKRCQRCMKTYYCGKDCQKSAWSQHKKVCKKL